MEQSEQIDKIGKALVAAQSAMEAATKDHVNPYFKSKYATLDNVIDVAKRALNGNGIAFMQSPGVGPDGEITVTTQLTHESGQWIRGTCGAKPAKVNDPQAVGSCITYLRRYSLAAVCGMATEEDDDGNSATPKDPPKSRREAPSNGKGKRPNASKLAALVGEWAGVNAEDVPAAVRDIAKAVGLKISAPITEAEAASLTKLISGAANDGQSFIDVVNAKGGD